MVYVLVVGVVVVLRLSVPIFLFLVFGIVLLRLFRWLVGLRSMPIRSLLVLGSFWRVGGLLVLVLASRVLGRPNVALVINGVGG